MVTSLTGDLLRDVGVDRDLFVATVGQGLARWMLDEENLGDLERPQHPSEHGSTIVLCAFKDTQRPPCCASGFGVPLQWKRKDVHNPPLHPPLPAELRELADQVIAAWKKTGVAEAEDWRLELHDSIRADVDLSGLEVSWRSGAAPLLASLRVAISGGAVQRSVYATGSLGTQTLRLEGIGSLAAKLEVVRRTRTVAATPRLYVPYENKDESLTSVEGVELCGLTPAERFDKQLENLLTSLDAEPPLGAEPSVMLEYHDRPWRTDAQRNRFYRSHLLEYLAEVLRARPEHSAFAGVDLLVVYLSYSPTLAELLALAIRPKRVILFYTVGERGSVKHLSDVTDRVTRAGIEIDARLLSGRTLDEEARIALIEALRPYGDRGMVDVTSGGGSVSVPFTVAAQKSGARIGYLDAPWDGKPKPGEERLYRLDWAEAPR